MKAVGHANLVVGHANLVCRAYRTGKNHPMGSVRHGYRALQAIAGLGNMPLVLESRTDG